MDASTEWALAATKILEEKRTAAVVKTNYRYFCMDCGKYEDAYMVAEYVWEAATGAARHPGFLCFIDLEKRLGRKLVITDFTACILNAPIFKGFLMAGERNG